MATKIKVTAIQTPSPDNTVTVARQLKESVEVGQRLRGDPNDSFVRVGELTQGGLWQLVNGVLVPSPATANPGGSIVVADSITGAGTVASPLELSGDSASPGNTMLYGTNGSGTKGWYAQPASSSSPLTTKGDIYVFGAANARLPVGSDGQVLTADSTQTNGLKWSAASSGPWVRNITESGGSLANFTTVSGTWTTSGGTINANNPNNAVLADQWCLKHNTAIPLSSEVVGCVVNVSAWNTTTTSRVGLYLWGTYANQSFGMVFIIQYNGVVGQATAGFLQPFTAGYGTSAAFSFALNADHTIRAIKNGTDIDLYVDGVYVMSDASTAGIHAQIGDAKNFVGLFIGGATAKFSNIGHWSNVVP